jgi:hypothetical protein
VSTVGVPAQVREGEPFYVEVVVDSNHDDEGDIEVFRGPHRVVAEKVKLKAGENKFRFRQQVAGERTSEYTARVKGFKTSSGHNAARGLVFTNGRPRVLLVDSDPKQAKHLAVASNKRASGSTPARRRASRTPWRTCKTTNCWCCRTSRPRPCPPAR